MLSLLFYRFLCSICARSLGDGNICTGWSATIHTCICVYSDAGIPINDDRIALHSNGAKFWNDAIWGRWLNGSQLNRELTLKTNLSIWIHLMLIGHIRSVSFFYDYILPIAFPLQFTCVLLVRTEYCRIVRSKLLVRAKQWYGYTFFNTYRICNYIVICFY